VVRWNPCETVLNVDTVGNLVLKWSYAAGKEVWSSPALVKGVVYVASYSAGNVYALKASTGATLWSYNTGNTVSSSPAVANGVIYVGSYNKNLYALNASTGAELWSYTTRGELYSSPTVANGVANGVVYVGSEDQTCTHSTPRPAPSCGGTSPATLYTCTRPPWPMGWLLSARKTTMCTLSTSRLAPSGGATPAAAM
jgi:glucose dehydrogenase